MFEKDLICKLMLEIKDTSNHRIKPSDRIYVLWHIVTLIKTNQKNNLFLNASLRQSWNNYCAINNTPCVTVYTNHIKHQSLNWYTKNCLMVIVFRSDVIVRGVPIADTFRPVWLVRRHIFSDVCHELNKSETKLI